MARLVRSPVMVPIPSIPGYDLLTPLGGGPMTVVYSAREHPDDRPCAVKTVRPDWPDQSTAVKLLQREARAGLGARHPRLVHVSHAQVTYPPYFLVMDLLPGESLRERLRRDYRLDVTEALAVTRQTAEALTALHRAGFLHGDVKPDNVRLTGAGSAVLIDLGFAHRPGENADFLRDGYVLGTADYLAPELCAAEPSEEYRSDLFSLGVTLFEALTGRLPYPPGSLMQTFLRHRCDPPADIRRLVPGLAEGVAVLVERLLAHQADQRPRAAAIVQQLVRLEINALGWRRSA
jgi:serine/threonine protein kinase